jgi:hypothetical protein
MANGAVLQTFCVKLRLATIAAANVLLMSQSRFPEIRDTDHRQTGQRFFLAKRITIQPGHILQRFAGGM